MRTQVSQPFVLGSNGHKEAVRALVDYPQPEYVEIDACRERVWRTWPAVGSAPLVMWCEAPASDGFFYKILDCTAFDKLPGGGALRLRALHATYAAYAAALQQSARDVLPPAALVPAELLYGAFELAVKMPFVGTCTVSEEALAAGGAVLDAVVPAIVWLARRGLMFVDLRGRNIVIDGNGHYCLVDYDDMVVLAEPATAAEALIGAMRADAAAKQYSCALDTIGPLEQQIRNCYVDAAQEARRAK